MKTFTKSSDAALARFLSSRLFKRIAFATLAALLATVFVLAACSAPQNESVNANAGQQPSAADWKPVVQALGKAGSMQPGDVYKVSLPRSDLKVTVGGVELKPALALGCWAAFKKTGATKLVMDD